MLWPEAAPESAVSVTPVLRFEAHAPRLSTLVVLSGRHSRQRGLRWRPADSDAEREAVGRMAARVIASLVAGSVSIKSVRVPWSVRANRLLESGHVNEAPPPAFFDNACRGGHDHPVE